MDAWQLVGLHYVAKKPHMSQAHWEATLEDPDGKQHIWIVYREHTTMLNVAGFKRYEEINRDSDCFVMVDSANRKIVEVMTQGWEPVTKEKALAYMAAGAGRNT